MPSPYDESVLRSLRRIMRATNIYSRHLAMNYQLTAAQLMCLHTMERKGQCTSGELASAMEISQATVTGILDRLESRGVVTRHRDVRDKRRVLVQITEAGQGLVEAAPPPLQQQFAERLAEAPEAEQQQIDRVLRQIVEMMSAERLDASPLLTAGPMSAESKETAEFLADETADPEPSAP